jgi:hypothetical protein
MRDEGLVDIITAIKVRAASTSREVVAALLEHPKNKGVIGAWLDIPTDNADDIIEAKNEIGEEPALTEVEANKLLSGNMIFRDIYKRALVGLPGAIWDTAQAIREGCEDTVKHHSYNPALTEVCAFYYSCVKSNIGPRPKHSSRFSR